ncbi:MAG: phosphoribosylaminoimidazolesuccinocarboxamide synthase [Firmicutes bacterium]|nr:phosphoribosylaminoimidazolesuccinocarboxamide synthase [Bacillota bacterium]
MKLLYEGKSKIIYEGLCEDTVIIKYKDTATAFNGEKREELAGKGQLNRAISNIIFAHLESNGVKTHRVTNILTLKQFREKYAGGDQGDQGDQGGQSEFCLVKKTQVIPVEIVVRNLAAGSFAKKYGVKWGSALNNVVFEFSVKSDVLGDPLINESQITALGLAPKYQLETMVKEATRINSLLTCLFKRAGIRLVDFKLEFGLEYKKGSLTTCIILIDEISPDSCRLWDIETNEILDKDRFRKDLGEVLEGYKKVLTRLESSKAKPKA